MKLSKPRLVEEFSEFLGRINRLN